MKIRFIKKLSAWALSNYGIPIYIIIIFYFHFFHDRVFALYSPTDIGFLVGTMLSHFMIFFYIWNFIVFLNKKKSITVRVENGSIYTESGKTIHFDTIIVKRRRIDDDLADIIFVDQDKTSFKVDVCYIGEYGLESIIADLKSLGCPIEIQRDML